MAMNARNILVILAIIFVVLGLIFPVPLWIAVLFICIAILIS